MTVLRIIERSILALSLASLLGIPVLAQQPYPQQPYPQQGAAPQGEQEQGGEDPGPGVGVARVSLLNGDVSVKRGDSGDYVAATLNAPLMVQDSVQTGPGARAEVQFDGSNLLRLAQNTEVHFTDLQNGHFQMELGRGTVTYRILQNTSAQVELDTPSISVRPLHPGIYRITVTDDGQTYVTPRNGQIEIYTPRGSQIISVGQTLMARGASSDPEYRLMGALGRDEWDAWSDSRDRTFEQAYAESSRYVSPDVYGTEELQGHGRWVNVPDYGYSWAPTVGADWSPYSAGRWVWEDYYGWTWVSNDPWGWAPYHYGRWFNRAGFGWCWWPGELHGRHYWSPALVGFFGYGGGIGVGFGSIGWVPLAPFEAFHPWWGRGGYGRDRFNNINIVRNVNITNVYRNARVGNGVMAMNAQQFGRGASGISRVSATDLRSASTMRGGVPVTPSAQSLHFSDRQTNTVARTNFSQSRFATHSQVPSVQRTPFAEQQRNVQMSNQRAFSSSNQNTGNAPSTGSSWNRFGRSAGTPAVDSGAQFGRNQSFNQSTPNNQFNSPASRAQSPASESGGWNRFGSPRGGSQSAGQQFGARESAGQSNVPAPSQNARPNNSGYQRYSNSERYSSPAPSYRNDSYGGGRSQIQISPPIVRERGNAPAPSYSQPRYSAPAYSTPRYSAPAYSAPRQQSQPSSSGSAHQSSGGGSSNRGSGGNGGGRHR